VRIPRDFWGKFLISEKVYCVRLGPGWWQDMYFGWYFVYEPGLVARSLAGDHSWVKAFLDSVQAKA
jgi:hypothetical protein